MSRVAIAFLLCVACTDTSGEAIELDVGDAADLGTWVQPLLRNQCAGLDCHGDAGRALRLYAKWGLRMDASLRGEDESPEELAANALSIAGVDPGVEPATHLMILKPLRVGEGGYSHVGGDIFDSFQHPGARCLLAWLDAKLPGDSDGEQACVDAAALPLP